MTARTPTGRDLYRDEDDRQAYLMLLAQETRDREWAVLSFCLMTNHVHLILRTNGDISAGMKAVHERYARLVNQSGPHQRGHVFGGRFHNKLIDTDEYFLAAMVYVARNPVAAGMCERASQWPWSAHAALAGELPAPRWLGVSEALAMMGASPDAARNLYCDLVDADDIALLQRLRATRADWLTLAVKAYGISLELIQRHCSMSRTTIYRRLAAERGTGVPGT